MAINSAFIRRPTDHKFFWGVAAVFPLLVLAGYFKTYYFKAFFDVPPAANWLVHFHAVVMSVWVLYFVAQIVLARTKNIKLHMSMGLAGIALAAMVVVVGLATAYDSHIVRHTAPPGLSPYSFLVIPLGDMMFFVATLATALVYRKNQFIHKPLMLLTAINFAAPALARLPIAPTDYFLLYTFGFPCVLAAAAFAWHTWKYRKFNKIYAAFTALFIIMQPVRIILGTSEAWVGFVSSIFGPA